MQPTNAAPDNPGPLGNAPQLPDAAPDAVQNLLNGIFGALNGGVTGIGDLVSGLADAIGGAASSPATNETAAMLGVAVLDTLTMLS